MTPPVVKRLLNPWAAAALVIVLVLMLLAIANGGEPLYRKIMEVVAKREMARDFIASLGPLAPVAFILLQILQIIISPIPGEATGFIGGFLFGSWLGFFYSTLGLSLGSGLAFWISRQFRRLVQDWLKASPLYNRFERLLEHQGLFVCFIFFLIPGFPKDFLCYLLGLSRMPWQAFLVIASVGRIPGTLMLSLQGANLYDGNVRGLFWLLGISLVVVAPSWWYREAIYEWVDRHSLEE